MRTRSLVLLYMDFLANFEEILKEARPVLYIFFFFQQSTYLRAQIELEAHILRIRSTHELQLGQI